VRFHRDGVQEGQDTIQAFGGQRQQAVAVLSATRYDPEQARLVAAEVATAGSVGGENAPWLETYESLGESGHGALLADSGQLQRSLTLAQQAIEARHKTWLGRSVVRSFSAGQRFALTDSPLDALDDLRPEEDKQFLLTDAHPRRPQQPAQGPGRDPRASSSPGAGGAATIRWPSSGPSGWSPR
jgi:uncharacterized protein involved in type VI secretion and phage assembly